MLGGVFFFFFEGCSEDFLYLFFSILLDTLFLLCDSKPCTHFNIYIYISRLLLHSFTYIFMCCFFSLFMHMLLINCFQSFIFKFHTKMMWWVLFKVFQKYKLSKSFLPWTLFLRSFSRVCARIRFIVFNKWVWVEWFMTSLICSFVCCGFVTDCKRGRLLGYMWIMLGTYVI